MTPSLKDVLLLWLIIILSPAIFVLGCNLALIIYAILPAIGAMPAEIGFAYSIAPNYGWWYVPLIIAAIALTIAAVVESKR
jgi:hypothetical protein